MRAIGIILAGGNNNKMKELSNKRAIAAMPVAGSFRSIVESRGAYIHSRQPLPQIITSGTEEPPMQWLRT